MDMKKTGSFLRELRREKNLTQEQLAEKLMVSNRTVSRWETGANLPDLGLLPQLAALYGVKIEELLNGERTGAKMEKEEEIVLKTAEYAGLQEKKLMKRMCVLFCAAAFFAVLSLGMQFVHPAPDTAASAVRDFLAGFGQGVSLGMLLLGALLTSGKLRTLCAAKRRLLAGKKEEG